MARSVFISYASEDKERADRICATLEEQGVQCWIAPRDIEAGDTWAAAIVQALAEVRLMLVLLSTHSNSSDQIPREVELAYTRRVPVLPVRLENVEPVGALEYYLRNRHWVDVFDPMAGPVEQRVVESVKRRLGQPASTVPPDAALPHGASGSKRRFARLRWGLLAVPLSLAWMVWSYVSTSNQPPASDRSTKVDPPAAPPPKSEQLSGPASIFEASKRSVVRIYIPNGGYGSGFIVTPEGHLLTADYVLGGEGPWRIATWDGTEHQAELVGVHAESKLAIARLRGAVTLPPLTFRSQKAVPDENVLVVGSTATDIVTYEQGVVRADEAEMVAAVFARFATGGLGGGPVIDERGKAIGLYYQRKQQPGASGESVRLFLPASTAVAVLRRFGIWTKPI